MNEQNNTLREHLTRAVQGRERVEAIEQLFNALSPDETWTLDIPGMRSPTGTSGWHSRGIRFGSVLITVDGDGDFQGCDHGSPEAAIACWNRVAEKVRHGVAAMTNGHEGHTCAASAIGTPVETHWRSDHEVDRLAAGYTVPDFYPGA